MNYRALALDYDGTLATGGTVDDATLEALRRARGAGLRVVLVTGRELPSLFNTFAHCDVFDRVVAENGAVLHNPVDASIAGLAAAPPPLLLRALQRANVPMSVGHSIVATVAPYEHCVRSAIRELGLDWHVIMNKNSVMALPGGVNKATGLTVALTQLEIAADETIGVGDAENDCDFLRMCGLAVAVANALPMVKAAAHQITRGARGAGVCEVVQSVIAAGAERYNPPR